MLDVVPPGIVRFVLGGRRGLAAGDGMTSQSSDESDELGTELVSGVAPPESVQGKEPGKERLAIEGVDGGTSLSVMLSSLVGTAAGVTSRLNDL